MTALESDISTFEFVFGCCEATLINLSMHFIFHGDRRKGGRKKKWGVRRERRGNDGWKNIDTRLQIRWIDPLFVMPQSLWAVIQYFKFLFSP